MKLTAPKSQIKIEIAPNIPSEQVEPTCFDMVVRNLISDAAKHHDKTSGKSTVRGFRDGARITIEVEDDGPGISATHKGRVFEPFTRLTKTEGTGLGFAFVKRSVIAWGGSTGISDALERGVIFSVSLPVPYDNVEATARGENPQAENIALKA